MWLSHPMSLRRPLLAHHQFQIQMDRSYTPKVSPKPCSVRSYWSAARQVFATLLTDGGRVFRQKEKRQDLALVATYNVKLLSGYQVPGPSFSVAECDGVR